MDEKEYRSIGYIGGIYEDDMVRIGARRQMCIRDSFYSDTDGRVYGIAYKIGI